VDDDSAGMALLPTSSQAGGPTRTCRVCKQQYREDENHPQACRLVGMRGLRFHDFVLIIGHQSSWPSTPDHSSHHRLIMSYWSPNQHYPNRKRPEASETVISTQFAGSPDVPGPCPWRLLR
jgi:hypothetical protein